MEKMAYFRPPPVPVVSFFGFRRLLDAGKLDGLVIVEAQLSPFTIEKVKICKLYDIPNVRVLNIGNHFEPFYKLDNEKVYIPYLETNLIDSCNLNCAGCTHFANLFTDNDVYKLEDFRRDVKQLSDRADIFRFRLMGGEPLKLKNLDKYMKVSRQFLPHSAIHLVTNALLLPSTPQYILDSMRENQITVVYSLYPPTLRMHDQIVKILSENNITHGPTTGKVESFNVFLSLFSGHNPEKSRRVCGGNLCRFLRDGKIYKCPIDGLSHRFAEYFRMNGFPAATGIDIFAKNFSALMEQLDGNIELCSWCHETNRMIAWKPENKPKLTDWLADPSELEKLLPK